MILLAATGGSDFFFPEQASNFAAEIDWLFWALFWISMFFFVGIMIAIVWFCVAFRKRPGYVGSKDALHNNVLEITWTVIPTFLVVWMFGQGVVGYLDMMTPPAGTEDIAVLAQQWAWKFTYPNGAVTAEELHLPVNRPVKFTMRSNDVIHSLYIPAFRFKQDVVPGRYTYMWVKPIMESKDVLDREGEPKGYFDLHCTEYCGEKHSMMNVKVYVHNEEDYQAWLAEAAKPPEEPDKHGQWLYERVGCKACHSIDGSKNAGPSWAGSWDSEVPIVGSGPVKFDENYVRESILNPQAKIHQGFENAKMNSYRGQLKDDQIDAIIAFMKTLKDAEKK